MAFIPILLKLFVAHLVGDFLLQTKKWTKHKQKHKIRSKYLYIHVLIHGVLAYLIVAEWNQFLIPILVIVTHWSIDLFKSYQNQHFKYFLIDQFLHILSLFLIWMFLYEQQVVFWNSFLTIMQNEAFWWVFLGYLFISNPTAISINVATQKWQKEFNDHKDSLHNAGKWIGILERVLTLTFILGNQFTAIGFLIAAKSIFRFGDLTNGKERKLTEYILIGTLLSFTITILIGIFIKSQMS